MHPHLTHKGAKTMVFLNLQEEQVSNLVFSVSLSVNITRPL